MRGACWVKKGDEGPFLVNESFLSGYLERGFERCPAPNAPAASGKEPPKKELLFRVYRPDGQSALTDQRQFDQLLEPQGWSRKEKKDGSTGRTEHQAPRGDAGAARAAERLEQSEGAPDEEPQSRERRGRKRPQG